MATLEQVEKLREKARVSYDEAKEALDASNGDLLDAMIYLEKKGKVDPPEGGGHYSSDDSQGNANSQSSAADAGNAEHTAGESLGELLRRFFKFCCKVVHKGNTNDFEIYKEDERKANFPITLLVLLIIFAFWLSIPLLIIGLFFGLRYRFNGPDIHKHTVNRAMDTAANAADDLKKSFKNSK